MFDVVIVGAGCVGCAIARRFTLGGARVLVLEQATDILDGASKGNSALLHTGFDAPPGSLEHACIARGFALFHEFREQVDLPLLATGALVVAWNDAQRERLAGIVVQAHNNGVRDVKLLDRAQTRAYEPGLSDQQCGSVLVPGEAVIDPWATPIAYLSEALKNGAELRSQCQLTGGQFDGESWRLHTTLGHIDTRFVINCAGLFGDTVDHHLLGTQAFRIRPRKGQFVVYDKCASAALSAIVLPVPNERTKGIVVSRTIFGNVLVGPTAEEQDSRTDASVDEATLAQLLAQAQALVPKLAQMPINATYAGIRPATEFKDYQIHRYPQAMITVGGIRSTGLSAALGIAEFVFDQYTVSGPEHQPLSNITMPDFPRLAEHLIRDWQLPGNGGVVCHCELVTRREIETALTGPLAARSLAGLKRQTRATLGRCQGFYCLAELSEITAGAFVQPIAGHGEISDAS